MFTYVYYVCFMHFLFLISKTNYISFTFMKICLNFISIFTYVISRDGLKKEEANARKIEGHFLLFQIFWLPQKKVITLKEATF